MSVMQSLVSLWLPIVASAVGVWVVSAVFWMAINHHEGDYGPMPGDVETDVVAKLRSAGVGPGVYLFPHVKNCGGDKQVQQAKFLEGPCGTLTVFPKPDGRRMGRNMLVSVSLYFAVSVLIAYIAALALPIKPSDGGAVSFVRVFQFCATAGVAAYAFSPLVHGVWFGQKTRALALMLVDGVAYGLVTGAMFAWLWPR
jgi:hypothetical protein